MTVTRDSLKSEINIAQKALAAAQAAYDAFDQAAENNVFESLAAAGALEGTLRDRASRDCEGPYNYGSDVYEQGFMVDGVAYVASLTCEYNRHDKTYYYLEGCDFKIEPK